MSIAIGIDLGTTNSVMAIVQGNVRALQNKQNENLTKSAVGFYKGKVIVGSDAMDRMAQDPKNLILSIKRLMGRGFSDEEIQKVTNNYLYEIKAPSNGSREDIRVMLASKEYSPIEISSMILKKIKEDAEDRLKDKVEYATITVPAYFTDKQVEATRLAGLMAGFKVQLILDEPTAAAIAFSVDQMNEDDARNIIIYDLGGGTFDVSVLTIAGGVCARLNTEGDMWLGGDDFDHKIMAYVVEKIKKDLGIDATKDLMFMMELKKKAEKAKIQLSGMPRTDILIPSILKDSKGNFVEVDYEITSEQFERMIEQKVADSLKIVKKALHRAGLIDDQIDNILLVGGSSTIPMVQRALEDTFGAHKILKNVDPMLCVAYGAAIIANRFGENVKCQDCETMNDGNNLTCTVCGKGLAIERQDNIMTTLCTNMPYGIETEGDKFEIIVPKNTSYPMHQHMYKVFEVPRPNLRRIKVPVYAGENEKASLNKHQFTVWLQIPNGTAEGTKLDVGFFVNGEGVFSSVKLRLKDGSGIEKEVFVNRDLGQDIGAERAMIENNVNQLKGIMDQNQEQLGASLYNDLDAGYQEIIDAIESNKIDEAKQKFIKLKEKIDATITPTQPEWVIKGESIISWSELALSRFGGYMEPDLTYRIKTKIENLKTAIQNNDEAAGKINFAELDKVTDEMPNLVFTLMRFTTSSFKASNMGLTVFSDKLITIISEIDKGFKAGDIALINNKIDEGLIIVKQIEGTKPDEPKSGTGLLRNEQQYKSSH